MKKIIALAVALVMALSMCTFSVMAAVEVVFEEISNGQLQDFVVTDLDFTGYTVTSSNTAIIAEDGTVTRPLFEDVKVALDISGTKFDVTVKAQNVNAVYYEDFSAKDGETKLEDYDWDVSAAKYENSLSAVEEGKATLNFEGDTDTYGRASAFYAIQGEEPGSTTVAFDISNLSGNVGSGIDIRAHVKVYYNDGTEAKATTENNFYRITSSVSGYGYGEKITGTILTAANNTAGKSGKVQMKIASNGEVFVGNDKGILVKSATDFTGENVERVEFLGFKFCNAGSGCGGSLDIDNLVVYQDVAEEDVLANATPAQKSAYFTKYLEEAYVTDGGSFKAVANNLKFTAEDLTEDATITWETDIDVVKEDGTVLRDMSETITTSITGTLSVEGAEDVVKTYSVTLLPLNVAGSTEILDGNYGTAGTSFAGQTGWKPASIKAYESMTVQTETNGNNYLRFGVSAYEPSGSVPTYTFASVPEIGEKIILKAKVRNPEKVKGVGNFTFTINGEEEAEFINYAGYIYDNDYYDGTNYDDYYGGNKSRADVLMQENQWYDIKVEINSADANAIFYINDKKVGEHKTKTGAAITEIESLGFFIKCRGTMDDASAPTYAAQYYDVDDVQVMTLLSDADAFQKAEDEVKFEFLKTYLTPEVFANGESLAAITKDLTFAPADVDLDAIGASLVWESSDESVVAADGKITQDAAIGKPVTVKGTLTVGDLAPVSATYAITVAPKGTEIYAASNKETMTWDFEDKEENSVDPMVGSYDDGTKGLAFENGTGTVTYKYDEQRGMVAEFIPSNEQVALKFFAGVRAGNHTDRYVAGVDVKFDIKDDATRYDLTYMLRGNNGGYVQGGFQNTDGTDVITIAPADSNVDGVARSGKGDMLFANRADHVNSIFEENVWHNITLDYNAKANVYYVYFDGVLVSEAPSSTKQTSGYPLLWIQLFTRNMASVQVDNQYVVKYSDADLVVADAALKSAVYNAASRETGQSGQPGFYRVIHRNDLDSVIVDALPTPQSAASGATLTWKINGAEHTGDTFTPPAKAEFVEFEVTATYNGKSVTDTFTNRMAPVKGIEYKYEKIDDKQHYTAIMLAGNVEGKKLIVRCREHAAEGKKAGKTVRIDFFNIADYYNTETGYFTFPEAYNYTVMGIECFIMDGGKITPIAFER